MPDEEKVERHRNVVPKKQYCVVKNTQSRPLELTFASGSIRIAPKGKVEILVEKLENDQFAKVQYDNFIKNGLLHFEKNIEK